jgi:hypothetical protein
MFPNLPLFFNVLIVFAETIILFFLPFTSIVIGCKLTFHFLLVAFNALDLLLPLCGDFPVSASFLAILNK